MREPQIRATQRVRATGLLVLAFAAATTLSGPPAPLTAAIPAIAAVIGPAPAYAGTWAQVTCSLATGKSAPIEGWTSSTSGGQAVNTCDPFVGGLEVDANSAGPLPALGGAIYTYTAPAGSRIAGGTITAALFAPDGIAYIATPAATLDDADKVAACVVGFPCGGQVNGALLAVIPITHPGGNQLFAVAQCLQPGTGFCPAGAGLAGFDAELNISQAIVDLTNNATPAASGFAGALLAPGPVSGTQPITFSATDPVGPGVYQVTINIDGQPVYSATPDTNGGHCVPAGIDSAGNNEFLYAQPCKPAVVVSIPVNTTKLADGPHDLSVIVTDAAGNSSPVLHQQIMAANLTTVSADLGKGLPMPAPPAAPIAAPAPPPVANGAGACAAAHLAAGFAGAAVGHASLGSPATLQGALSCAGQPIGAATIDISVALHGGRAAPTTAQVHTAADGGFVLPLPPGPSRDLTLTYRAFSGAAAPTATASARLEVRPSIALSIAPPRVHNGQTITYTGRVFGGFIPPAGLPLEVQYRDGARWRTFDQTRAAAADGSFVFHYTFRRTTIPIVYEFRMLIPPAGASGYPYASSASRPRSVRVEP